MSQKPVTQRAAAEKVVKEIRRATRKQHSAEEKIRIVLAGLRGEDSIAEHCRREGIAQSLYYSWSKEFLEAGKRLAGDTARGGKVGEVKDLRVRRRRSILWRHPSFAPFRQAQNSFLPRKCAFSLKTRLSAG